MLTLHPDARRYLRRPALLLNTATLSRLFITCAPIRGTSIFSTPKSDFFIFMSFSATMAAAPPCQYVPQTVGFVEFNIPTAAVHYISSLLPGVDVSILAADFFMEALWDEFSLLVPDMNRCFMGCFYSSSHYPLTLVASISAETLTPSDYKEAIEPLLSYWFAFIRSRQQRLTGTLDLPPLDIDILDLCSFRLLPSFTVNKDPVE